MTGVFTARIPGLEGIGHGELACLIGKALRDKNITYDRVTVSYEPDRAPTRTYLTGEAREQAKQTAAARYAEGLSVRAVAAEIGLSFSSTHALLQQAGVTFRPRGGDMRKGGE